MHLVRKVIVVPLLQIKPRRLPQHGGESELHFLERRYSGLNTFSIVEFTLPISIARSVSAFSRFCTRTFD